MEWSETVFRKIDNDLPVFACLHGLYLVLYTPGNIAVLKSSDKKKIYAFFAGDLNALSGFGEKKSVFMIKDCAQKSLAVVEKQKNTRYEPVNLTIYLSNECNCRCRYCFSQRRPKPPDILNGHLLSIEALKSGAKIVGLNCAKNNLPFSITIHGGGEPMLYPETVKKTIKETKKIAKNYNIGWQGHLATNGTFDDKNLSWIVDHFSSIGLSCDGPPDIQNRQRPFYNKMPTSDQVEKNSAIILKKTGKLEIRATITPDTLKRQSEIAAYLCSILGATHIRFEPVYRQNAYNQQGFCSKDANAFVHHFISAQETAGKYGCDLSFSGVRMDSLHSSYCSLLKNTLHLLPDNTATACFFSTDSTSETGRQYLVGKFGQNNKFIFDNDKIKSHITASTLINKRCSKCINIFHCAGTCPEICTIVKTDTTKQQREAALFRCLVQKKLTFRWIMDAVDNIIASQKEPKQILYTGRNDIDEILDAIPDALDKNFILNQYKALNTDHEDGYKISDNLLPSPIWQKRGYDCSDTEAEAYLSDKIKSVCKTSPVSIYLHIPFCINKCAFCDCYSLSVQSNSSTRQKKLVNALEKEMDFWTQSGCLGSCPVTTIHFGGGTPTFLQPELFKDIILKLKQSFSISLKTELAVESTAFLLSDAQFIHLQKLNISRLHIGVQTLCDSLRARIGRTMKSQEVIDRIKKSLSLGFITSADIIYGLPGQTTMDIYNTVCKLMDTGIHGISFYRLSMSANNKLFTTRYSEIMPNSLETYVMLHMLDQLLFNAGYRKNHFSHFALPEDQNLYFRHAARNENLIAMGPVSNGILDSMHYKHKKYTSYVKNGQTPAIEGIIQETRPEHQESRIVNAIMSGSFDKTFFKDSILPDKWLQHKMIGFNPENNNYYLKGNGSYLISGMIRDVHTSLNREMHN